jgi:hypothetical protein
MFAMSTMDASEYRVREVYYEPWAVDTGRYAPLELSIE